MTTSEPAKAPTPKPIPRPGRPLPAPPGARTAGGQTGPKIGPNIVAADPRRFGRVDADGTVWLIGTGGERVIGSWQAGDAAAAYAHFGRRFEDLSTEIALLERRLAAHSGDARKIKAAADGLAAGLPAAAVLGDVDALASRLSAIAEQADAAALAERAERDEHRAHQAERKEALAAEAEELATTTTQWKAAGDRLRDILDEWRTINGLDRKSDDALWKRYSAARESFNRRRGAHFAELDRERVGARQAKEALCARAEALTGSTDWGPTGAAFRDLLTEWKAAGRASKEVDNALWRRFKAAQDTFFAARDAVAAAGEEQLRTNATAKEALLVAAEKIDLGDVAAARTALRALTEQWDAIGKVPREQSAELDRRLRAVEKKVRDAADSGWGDPAAKARAEQFQERAEQFERQARKAEAAGRAKDAETAKANAEQWRQWARAAVDALSKKR